MKPKALKTARIIEKQEIQCQLLSNNIGRFFSRASQLPDAATVLRQHRKSVPLSQLWELSRNGGKAQRARVNLLTAIFSYIYSILDFPFFADKSSYFTYQYQLFIENVEEQRLERISESEQQGKELSVDEYEEDSPEYL